MNYYSFGISKILLGIVTIIDVVLVYFMSDIYILRPQMAFLVMVAAVASKYPILKIFTATLNRKQLRLATISCASSLVLSIVAGLFFVGNMGISLFKTSGIVTLALMPLGICIKIWLLVQMNMLRALATINETVPSISTAISWATGAAQET